MDLSSVKIGTKLKYSRNGKIKIIKVYEIGKSYGSKKIFYNFNGGFCMENEVIKICKIKAL